MGVTGGISRVSTGVSSSLDTVRSSAKVLTSFVTDQRLKDCLLQTVCYLTPLTEEEDEVGGFTGRKKTKEQRKTKKCRTKTMMIMITTVTIMIMTVTMMKKMTPTMKKMKMRMTRRKLKRLRIAKYSNVMR